jgi:hypothetical protein
MLPIAAQLVRQAMERRVARRPAPRTTRRSA